MEYMPTDELVHGQRGPEFVQRGKVLIVKREFQEAVKVCRLGLLSAPGDLEGRLVLAMALMALGRYDEVLAEMRVAAELSSDNAMVYLLRGEALLYKERYVDALHTLVRAQELDPCNAKIDKLIDEVGQYVDVSESAISSPRSKTGTKVYPSRRAQEVHTATQAEPEGGSAWSDDADPTEREPEPSRMRGTLAPADEASFGAPPFGEEITNDWPDASQSEVGQLVGSAGNWEETVAPANGQDGPLEQPPAVMSSLPFPEGIGVALPDASLGRAPWAAHERDVVGASEPAGRDQPTLIEDDVSQLEARLAAQERSSSDLGPISQLAGGAAGPASEVPGEQGEHAHRRLPDQKTGALGIRGAGSLHVKDLPPILANGAEDSAETGLAKSAAEDQPREHARRAGQATAHVPLGTIDAVGTAGAEKANAPVRAMASETGTAPVSSVEEPPRDSAQRPEPSPAVVDERNGQSLGLPSEGGVSSEQPSDNGLAGTPNHAPRLASQWRRRETVVGDEKSLAPPRLDPPLAADSRPDSAISVLSEVAIEILEATGQATSEPGVSAVDSQPGRQLDEESEEATRVKFDLDDQAAVAPVAKLDPEMHSGDDPTVDLRGPGEEFSLNLNDSSLLSVHQSRPPPTAYPDAVADFSPAEQWERQRAVAPYAEGPRPTQPPHGALPPPAHRSPHSASIAIEAADFSEFDVDVAPPRAAAELPKQDAGPTDSVLLRQLSAGSFEAVPFAAASPSVSVPRGNIQSESLFTRLVGPSGRRRWKLLVGLAFGVIGLGAALGGYTRYRRRAKRESTAVLSRLKQGNYSDFLAARRALETLAVGTADRAAGNQLALVTAALPFEFGDRALRRAGLADGGGLDEESKRIVATLDALVAGRLEQAEPLVSGPATVLSPWLSYLRGRYELLRGRPKEALKWLERAAQKLSGYAMVLRWLGEANRLLGDVPAAKRAFAKALVVNPRHIWTQLSQVSLQLDRGLKLADAKVTLHDLLRGALQQLVNPTQRAWAYLLSARLAWLHGEMRAFDGYLAGIRGSEPNGDPDFFDELAALYVSSERFGLARRAVQRSLQIMAARQQPKLQRARILIAEGRPRVALDQLGRIKDQTPALHLARARAALYAGQYQLAEQLLLKSGDETRPVVLLKAEIRAAQGRLSEVVASLEALMAEGDATPALLVQVARIYVTGAAAKGAVKILKRAARAAGGEFGWIRLEMARALSNSGNADAARSRLRELSAEAGNVPARLLLARIDFEGGRLDDARATLEAIRERVPKHRPTLLLWARVATAQRAYRAVQRLLTEHKLADPLAEGRLLFAQGQPTAIRKLEAACAAAPTSVEAWQLLVRAYLLESASAARAEEAVERMRRRLGAHPAVKLAEGRIAWSRGKLSIAGRHLRQAISASKAYSLPPIVLSEIRVLLGRVLSDAGRLDEALNQYRAAHDLCPKCPEALHRQALVLEERGRLAEAVRLMTRALKLDRSNPDLYLDLAKIYEGGEDTGQAIAMYRKYLSLNPPQDLARDARQALQALQ